MKLQKPNMLVPGDNIAAVSPSWGGAGKFPHRYQAGKRQLEAAYGVRVIEMPNTLKSDEWLHANPQARAADLMQAFSDPDIKAIIATIGGSDSIRLLPYLDLEVIAGTPKIFMGYSDTTCLHFACVKAGLSSFSGPAIMTGFAENGGIFPYLANALRAALFSKAPIGAILNAPEWTGEEMDWTRPENQERPRRMTPAQGRQCLQGHGLAAGALIGGCIDVFPMLLGTAIWPSLASFNDAILFLETSEQAPSPNLVRYIMRNLGVQGVLDRLAGILIGRPGGNIPDLGVYDRVIQNVVADEFARPDLPIISQMEFGHTDPICVLPYGALCELNCETCEVAILESGVL